MIAGMTAKLHTTVVADMSEPTIQILIVGNTNRIGHADEPITTAKAVGRRPPCYPSAEYREHDPFDASAGHLEDHASPLDYSAKIGPCVMYGENLQERFVARWK